MRDSNKWFKLLTILAGSGILMASGCGWTMGVNWIYAGIVAALGLGALVVLASTTPVA
jgi:hypothetical protein